MRDSVAEKFVEFMEPYEGFVFHMYADRKGLVTTGLGNLIESGGRITSEGLDLDWKRPDGSLASHEEIRAAFNAVKDYANQFESDGKFLVGITGGNSDVQRRLTDLRINRSDVIKLVKSKLEQMETTLRQRYHGYDAFPADAQLGLIRMSWAMGPGFNFPKFRNAANQLIPDFITMALESSIPELNRRDKDGNIIEHPSNVAVRQLFSNAANVLKSGANPDIIYWPNAVVAAGIGITSLGLFGVGGYFLYRYLQGKGVL